MGLGRREQERGEIQGWPQGKSEGGNSVVYLLLE